MARSNQTKRLTVAQAIVQYLKKQYSEFDGKEQRLVAGMFGIFGHGNVAGLGQALTEYADDFPYYQPCNEQSMVHTSIGYAKANLRRSLLACASSVGPGATNMITGAATATSNRMPVLLFPADIYVTRHQGPVLQQIVHPVDADVSVNDGFRPMSRFFDRISRPEQLLTALPEAMRVLTNPAETGAVTIALPQDIQSHAYDYPLHFFDKHVWRIERPVPIPQRIEEAADILAKAKLPYIIAGGGVLYSEAGKDLKKFCEEFGVPIGETMAGKGSILGDSDMLCGACGITGTSAAADISLAADVVLSIGTRLTDFTTGSHSAFQNPKVKFIHINVCGKDAFQMGSLPIQADAKVSLQALSRALRKRGVKPSPTVLNKVARAKKKWAKVVDEQIFTQYKGEIMSQAQVLKVVNEEAKVGDTVISAAGSPPGDLHQLWECGNGKTCHLEFGNSCMGYEIPAGVGVRMTQPKGEVCVFIGDGTFLMNPTEMVTALQENLKMTVVVNQNYGFQVIRRLQLFKADKSFGNEFRKRVPKMDRLEGEYTPVDIGKMAEGMGARVWYVSTPDEVRAALREARKEKRSCCIVAEIEKHRFPPGPGLWWDVAPAEVSNDPAVRKLRKEYEKNRDSQKLLY